MANTVTLTTNFSINNNGSIASKAATVYYTTTGSVYNSFDQPIGIAGYDQLSSSYSNHDYIQFFNNDSTSSITIATDNAGTKTVSTLAPGRVALLSWSGSATFYAKATPSSSYLNVRGVPV